METSNIIKIKSSIDAPVEKVWNYWTAPQHITQWNNASDDWHSPRAENDLRPGGRFCYRMEARDGSAGFDYEGTYREVKPNQHISYTLDDGRKVDIHFKDNGSRTEITESFEADETHSMDMQRQGWQAILDNFKKYVESN